MYQSVVVALDGSQYAARALPFAKRLCAKGGELVAVRAIENLSRAVVTNASAVRIAASRQAAAQAEVEQEMEAVAADLRQDGFHVTSRVGVHDPAGFIVDTATESKADVIVLTTHGRPGPLRAVLGSVAEEVLRAATLPVLLIPNAAEQVWPSEQPMRVLVALDGSDVAEQVIPQATALAATLQAELLLLRITESADASDTEVTARYLADLTPRLGADGQQVRSLAGQGEPAKQILEFARKEQIQAIAIASHGRSGLARLLLGSVTTAVLHQADVPMLVLGPSANRLLIAPQGSPTAAQTDR